MIIHITFAFSGNLVYIALFNEDVMKFIFFWFVILLIGMIYEYLECLDAFFSVLGKPFLVGIIIFV